MANRPVRAILVVVIAPSLVTLDFSRPGKPTDNAYAEASNSRVRAECMNAHWFLTLADLREKKPARPPDRDIPLTPNAAHELAQIYDRLSFMASRQLCLKRR